MPEGYEARNNDASFPRILQGHRRRRRRRDRGGGLRICDAKYVSSV